ncbi:ABC transporter substrate-binding protein [bacterium]|nr:ABC transporter substrate-binding protein [bacterium]
MNFKRLKIILVLAGSVLFITSAWAFILPGGSMGRLKFRPLAHGEMPRRIVSMAPAITETLFAIGAKDLVKGVTNYCVYPPEVKKLPKIGGYYDPNYEAIMALNPDLVIILPEHREHRLRFQQLNISTLTMEMHSLAGVISTFIQLGNLCQCEFQGAWLADAFSRQLIKAREQTRNLTRKKVMLVIGRDYGQGISEVYIAGQGEFYHELLDLAGGENVYQRAAPKYPQVSVEGILAMNPEVVIELIPDPEGIGKTIEEIRADWSGLPGLPAVQQKQIKILTGDFLVVPGPRMMLLLKALGEALHPELEWK